MWPCDSSAVTFCGGLGMFSVAEAMGNVGIGLLMSSNNDTLYSGDYTTRLISITLLLLCQRSRPGIPRSL